MNDNFIKTFNDIVISLAIAYYDFDEFTIK